MKEKKLFSEIRDRKLPTQKFRKNSNSLSIFLAKKTLAKIPKQKLDKVVIVMVLRSSLAMLPAFLKYFPTAPVGFIGLKRDEKTAIAKKYYENLPKFNKNSVVIVPDPMLATGGSLNQTLVILMEKGVLPKNIYFTGFIGATEGVDLTTQIIPKENITLFAIDPKLDSKKYIVPGLGDFGDRYFRSN
ncbi:MAG: uracil phosphoribosyltransferase [Candidatus Paceibacterota bacterium]